MPAGPALQGPPPTLLLQMDPKVRGATGTRVSFLMQAQSRRLLSRGCRPTLPARSIPWAHVLYLTQVGTADDGRQRWEQHRSGLCPAAGSRDTEQPKGARFIRAASRPAGRKRRLHTLQMFTLCKLKPKNKRKQSEGLVRDGRPPSSARRGAWGAQCRRTAAKRRAAGWLLPAAGGFYCAGQSVGQADDAPCSS